MIKWLTQHQYAMIKARVPVKIMVGNVQYTFKVKPRYYQTPLSLSAYRRRLERLEQALRKRRRRK